MANTPMQMDMETERNQSVKQTPIVPPSNIAGQALSLVIAIMSFLACLTVGAVLMIDKSASSWQSQISREATIQIRPARDFDIETALMEAQAIAAGFDGVTDARIIDMSQTANLLEPWLGTDINLNELPVPRLVVIRIDERNPPDFKAIGTAINEAIPNATLDDHRAWVDRLVSMAHTTTYVGIAILALVLTALVLTVVFATRGALASNHIIIEVLHFVGARANFIAGQFQRRFFWIGLRGAMFGGGAAVVLFLVFQFWAQRNLTTAQGEQVAVLFGDFSIGISTFTGAFFVVALVAVLTTLTARLTVIRTIYEIDEQRADPSRQSY